MVIYIVWRLELIQRIIAQLVMNVKQGVNMLETCLPTTTWLGACKDCCAIGHGASGLPRPQQWCGKPATPPVMARQLEACLQHVRPICVLSNGTQQHKVNATLKDDNHHHFKFDIQGQWNT
jgi:hypothetical protein